MVKLATSVIAVTLLAIPAFAASSQHHERSVSENDIYGRSIESFDDIVVTREDLIDIYGREFIEHVEKRNPFGLGMLFKLGKGIAKVAKHAHHGSSNNNNNHRREFDDEVYEREFEDEDLMEREFDDEDLLEREYFEGLD